MSRLRLLGAGLVLALAMTPTAVGRAAGPSPSPPGDAPPVTVRLGALTPIAAQPGDTLVLTGVLQNTSAASVGNLELSLRFRRTRVGSRDEFDNYANTADGTLSSLPDVASAAAVTLSRSTLAAGQTGSFRVSVPVDTLALPRSSWQVYEIGLQLDGTTPDGGRTLGRLRTFLPWAPLGVPGVGVRTQVAWVWPLVDRPHRSVGSTWLDDGLAAEMAAGGRLTSLLAAGDAAEQQRPHPASLPHRRVAHPRPAPPRPTIVAVPVTWAVDPMLVEDATAMANGYRVGTGTQTRPGAGAAAAKAWLDHLRQAAGRGEVLALPYADPDLVAANRAGLGGESQVALNAGQTLLASALSVAPLSYVWPPAGLLDQHTLDLLFAAGVSTVVLDGSALPVTGGEPNETPSAHAVVRGRDGNLDALLVDSGLRAVVASGLDDPALQPLAVQRFLAETLMIQAEQPFDQRAVVLAPDRRWAPAAAYARALIMDSGRVPWIQPVSLSDVAAGPVYTKVVRQALSYPPSARPAELSQRYLARVRATKARADLFAAILPTGAPAARSYDDAVLRGLSSAWRDDPTAGAHTLEAVRASLATTMRRVRIASPPNSFVTLTSHSGTVPVTVSNELDTPVHVVVGISSQHLKLSGSGRTEEPIPAHRQSTIDVRAAAQTSGVFPLEVTLYTPSGQSYQTVKLYVRSTAYGAVALIITGGATAVLMLAVVVRLFRRGVTARRVVAGDHPA
jgi:hypothetical protein